ncbi:GNAT family N-acetyltransferase [Wenzhouxiangella sp. XN79A]|uniref:GNAT family N-acetyltransferase n=1 Tax=Wenzhouxiangella sp. XN79A TaxID=2724193 RepID=UPI00144AAA3E|nr:peptidogalycan biosysnthesis protein [Wenzhouxiangella sp. XN79A]NKI34795.1 GNAT family N-acetyltransferase [Wenzhouxiangella sp. XN79A]
MQKSSSTSPEAGDLARLDPAAWNALNRDENPFTDARFLRAAGESGCVEGATGWHWAGLALPGWIKLHSHGEFVFDFAWADAAQRNGLPWYPKLLIAAPFTPVTGPRLFGHDRDARAAALAGIEQRLTDDGLPAASINFGDAHDAEVLDDSTWLGRFGWQYHWHNRDWRSFDDFLAALRAKPRKNIRQERRRANEGWRYRWLDGATISDEELATVAGCYRTTHLLYGNRPSLNEDFFRRAARDFGDRFLVCMAARDGLDRACGVFWRSSSRLYGRYWGALEETRDVHFECCYYRGIEYCIEHGLAVFEPGAQGEHKIRRGFVPVRTRSWHWIAHPGLREGIRHWLGMEAEALVQHRRRLDELVPYRAFEPAEADR